jgi:hypothetical protein
VHFMVILRKRRNKGRMPQPDTLFRVWPCLVPDLGTKFRSAVACCYCLLFGPNSDCSSAQVGCLCTLINVPFWPCKSAWAHAWTVQTLCKLKQLQIQWIHDNKML